LAPAIPGAVNVHVAVMAANGNNAPSGDSPGLRDFQWVFGCTATTFYADLDRDGFGSKAWGTLLGCAGDAAPGWSTRTPRPSRCGPTVTATATTPFKRARPGWVAETSPDTRRAEATATTGTPPSIPAPQRFATSRTTTATPGSTSESARPAGSPGARATARPAIPQIAFPDRPRKRAATRSTTIATASSTTAPARRAWSARVPSASQPAAVGRAGPEASRAPPRAVGERRRFPPGARAAPAVDPGALPHRPGAAALLRPSLVGGESATAGPPQGPPRPSRSASPSWVSAGPSDADTRGFPPSRRQGGSIGRKTSDRARVSRT
jgi:hypothetical protein